MSAQRQGALSTLVRWREFQEAKAEILYQKCAAEAGIAREAKVAAQSVVDAIESRRTAVLSSSALDIAYTEMLAAIAERAWGDLDSKNEADAQAERNRLDALSMHHAARTAVQVAELRHGEFVRAGRDAAEKRMYDQMQDLRNGSLGEAHAR